MRVFGPLVIIAVLGVGVYVTFIADHVPNPGESLAVTRECIDENTALAVDDEVTEAANEGLGYGEALAFGGRSGYVVLYVFSSEPDAVQAESEIREAAGSREGGERAVERKQFEVLVGQPSARQAAGRCVWAVSTPRFSSMTFFELKTVGRPFDPTFLED